MKMFADFEKAQSRAKKVAEALDSGKVDVVELRGHERVAYLHTLELLAPTGIALEFAAIDYIEAWRMLEGKAPLVEAFREYVKRHLHELPDKMPPEAVKEMLTDKEREGASNAYLKVLRFLPRPTGRRFQLPVAGADEQPARRVSARHGSPAGCQRQRARRSWDPRPGAPARRSTGH